MPVYLRYAASDLPHSVGKNIDGGVRISDNQSGHICFGPYCGLDAGDYVAGFYLKRTGGESNFRVDMDVSSLALGEFAKVEVEAGELFDSVAGLVAIPFRLLERADNLEVRMYVPAEAEIALHELVIFSATPRGWGGQ